MSGFIEAVRPEEVLQLVQDIGLYLVVPAALGTLAYARARQHATKTAGSDEIKVRLEEINQYKKAFNAARKANDSAIDLYLKMKSTTSQGQISKIRPHFEAALISNIDPDEWNKKKTGDKNKYLFEQEQQVRILSDPNELKKYDKERARLLGRAGIGVVNDSVKRVSGFFSNEVKQTVEAAAIGFAIDIVYALPGMDALTKAVNWVNGVASLSDKGILVVETLGIAVATAYLAERALNVHPGK